MKMMAEEMEILAAIKNLENQEIAGQHQRERHIARDAFRLSDKKFIKTYRLTKELTRQLIESLEPHVIQGHHASSLSVQEKVLISLNFYATGSYQSNAGDNKNMAVSQSSVSRSIAQITSALNQPEMFSRFVKFPRNIEELDVLRRRFYHSFGMPGIVGCSDCTHVAIVPPKTNDPIAPEYVFVNRKNYHSINVQLICDDALKILNVNARFPGSTHDTHIWNNINVEQLFVNFFQRGIEGYFLLGDSGYPLRPWLITPLQNPQSEEEELFNEVQKKARCSIERCNGLLKMRFRCLLKHRTLHYSPQKCSQIINACVVLHNMCIENNVELLLNEDEEQEEIDLGILPGVNYNENDRRNPLLVQGLRVQRRLINHFR